MLKKSVRAGQAETNQKCSPRPARWENKNQIFSALRTLRHQIQPSIHAARAQNTNQKQNPKDERYNFENVNENEP